MELMLRKAAVADIKAIHAMLLQAAQSGQLLPRSLSQLYNHTRDFYVLMQGDGALAGCCALSVVWEDLAEIRSLYVKESLRGAGCGRRLVEACFDDAAALGIRRAFTLTYKTGFFSRLGFDEVGKDVLPQKIWADCIHCPKFPDCDEVAMLRSLP